MLTIDIVSDIVCPWCFIGTRRLAAAIAMIRAERPDFRHAVRWRPFFLNPDTPPEGEPYLPFLEHKFGSRAAVDALFERVRVAGQAYGLEYAFEKIALRANTLHAHRLLHWAQTRNPEPDKIARLVERLFIGQFQRGEHVGDRETLARIAAESGYDADAVSAYLASGEGIDAVRQDAAAIQALGIRQVPTFILPGNDIIVGAEDPAILAAGIRRALA